MATIAFCLVILLLSTSCIQGEEVVTPAQESGHLSTSGHRPGESANSGRRNIFDNSEDSFINANDTSCVIIDGLSVEEFEPCHELEEKPITLMLRKQWEEEMGIIELEAPAEYVFIKEGGELCYATRDCITNIQSMRRKGRSQSCDLLENFYVGGDGHVYEGRGWDYAPYWHLNGLRNKSITVQFLGSFQQILSNPLACEAFETAMGEGMWMGKISKSYKLTSVSQVPNGSAISTHQFCSDLLRSDRWLNRDDLSALWEHTVPGRLRIVFRNRWNASNDVREFEDLSLPVDYVVISEGGERCTSRDECTSKMKAEQSEQRKFYGDVLENFYIADEGEVYEGRGWDSAPHWFLKGLRRRYISVRLLGTFGGALPSENAINSFKLLVQAGVWLGKISPKYQLLSLSQVYNQSVLLSDNLRQVMQRWSVWSKNISSLSITSRGYPGLLPLVTRTEWTLNASSKSFPPANIPAEYVTISDGGHRCFTYQECTSRMRSEENSTLETYGGLLDNFYVGDDGTIYEGRGWDVIPHLQTPFFNRSIISLKFLGSFQDTPPSRPMWLSFLALLNTGMSMRKISPSFKFYSFRHIFNDSSLLGDELSGIFEKMDTWAGELTAMTEKQRASEGLLPFYWTDESMLNTIPSGNNYSLPRHNHPTYIVVRSLTMNCISHDHCSISTLGEVSQYLLLVRTNNFFVFDGGNITFLHGGNNNPFWNTKGTTDRNLFVCFFGKSRDFVPSKLAITAFHRLLSYGVQTGFISSDYKVVSARQVFADTTIIGDRFSKIIMSWKRWSEYEAFDSEGNSLPTGPPAFVSRNQWSLKDKPFVISKNLSSSIEYVVILDAGDRCASLDECVTRVQAIQNRSHPTFVDAMENFYVGEDGRIYEGRGWSQVTRWCPKNSNCNFITVAFLGKFENELPSSKALAAFNHLFKWGILKRKIWLTYELISLRQIFPAGGSPGRALDQNIRTWDDWSKNASNVDMTHLFSIVTPTQWGKTASIRRANSLYNPVKYVYIREGGSPCIQEDQCITQMRFAEQGNDQITENFYIGGNGVVYEGIGWKYDTKWGYPQWRSSLSIQFFGSFENDAPTPDAVAAFDLLCRYGVKEKYISPTYNLLYIPDNYNSRMWVGNKFKEIIKTWDRWVPKAN